MCPDQPCQGSGRDSTSTYGWPTGSFGFGGRSATASRRTAPGSNPSTPEVSYAPPCPRAVSGPYRSVVSAGVTSWNQLTSSRLAVRRPETHSIAARTVDMLASWPLTISSRGKPAATIPSITSAR